MIDKKILKKYFKDGKETKEGKQQMANAFIDEYNIKTVGKTKPTLFVYQNGFYIDGDKLLKKRIEEILEELATSPIVNEILAKIKNITSEEREGLTPDCKYVNLKNGIYDIYTHKLKCHTPDIFFEYQIPLIYDPSATCPMIDSFFNEIFYESDIPVIYEFLGYVLYRKNIIKKAIMLTGPKNTGKTTFLKLLCEYVGDKNYSGLTLHQISNDKFAAASFHNKHVNFYDDLDDQSIKNVGQFKVATGGGKVSAEYKFGDSFTFNSYAKMIFSCNKIPNVKSIDDDAYFERWILIRLSKIIEKKDPFLLERITSDSEKSGLLNRALAGLKSLFVNKEFSYAHDSQDVKKEMSKSSSSIAMFAYNRLEEKTDDFIEKDDMYAEYVKHCNNHKLTVESTNIFTREITKHAPYMILKGKHLVAFKRVWLNVKIKEDFNVEDAQVVEDDLDEIMLKKLEG